MMKVFVILISLSLISLSSCNMSDSNCKELNENYLESINYLNPATGIEIYFDIDCAINESKRVNKPVLLMFSGYGVHSTNPPIEWELIRNSDIRNFINQNYIFTCLLVDDRSDSRLKGITKGQRWKNFQMEKFHSNQQPFFVIVKGGNIEKFELFDNTNFLSVDKFYLFLQNAIKSI